MDSTNTHQRRLRALVAALTAPILPAIGAACGGAVTAPGAGVEVDGAIDHLERVDVAGDAGLCFADPREAEFLPKTQCGVPICTSPMAFGEGPDECQPTTTLPDGAALPQNRRVVCFPRPADSCDVYSLDCILDAYDCGRVDRGTYVRCGPLRGEGDTCCYVVVGDCAIR